MFDSSEDQNFFLVIMGITYIVSLIIMYVLISSAVRSGTKDADVWNQHYLKINNRLLIALLIQQGMRPMDISNLINAQEDDFWPTVMKIELNQPVDVDGSSAQTI